MHPGESLTDAMRTWATPNASLINYSESPETFQPRASDPEKSSPNQSLKGKPALAAQAQWPTAAASDFKGSSKIGQRRGQLSEAILRHGRHVQATSKDGGESSKRTPSSLRLNPAFVEWLMGWPPGWSLPGADFASGKTSSMRSGPID